MSRTPHAILRTAMVAGFGLTLVLTGCGAGQHTQTAEQQAAVNGANGDAGPIAVRNAQLVYPEDGAHGYKTGEDASMVVTIANGGATEDELTSISSPAADAVEIEGQRGLPGQRTLVAVGEGDGVDAAAGSTGSGTAGLSLGQIRITLRDLTEDVRPGRTIPVTLLFRQAGEVTVDVPIGSTDEERSEAGSDH